MVQPELVNSFVRLFKTEPKPLRKRGIGQGKFAQSCIKLCFLSLRATSGERIEERGSQ